MAIRSRRPDAAGFRAWLARESPRQTIASALSGAVILIFMPWSFDTIWTSRFAVFGILLVPYGIAMVVLALSYALLTFIAFRDRTGDALASLARHSSPRTLLERRRMQFFGTNEGSLAVTVAIVSLIFVAMLLLDPEVREVEWAVPAVLASVLSSWALIVTSFAVKYLREWAVASAITFEADSEPPQFSDFVFLAVQMSTGYAAGLGHFRTSAARRTATFHNVLAFIFNSVIIALLVTVALPAVV